MDSRKGALSALRKNLRSASEDLSPVKKVSVMADSEKGLEEGLEKAKDLMESGVVDEMVDEVDSENPFEDEMEEVEKDISDEALAMMSREDLIECVRKMRDEDSLED